MGEIAEMMLDGTMCEGCGEFFDDIINGGEAPGYPRRCRACRVPTPKGYLRPTSQPQKPLPQPPLGAKDIKWLKHLLDFTDRPLGMYPGDHWSLAPARFEKLAKRGLVRLYEPHNMAHKARAVITDAGRAALKGETS